MNRNSMTSMERVLAAIGHTEPDRVPLLLLLSMYGAKELQIPIKEYFHSPQNVIRAQLLMKKKYNNDCIYTFSYAPIEIEAWGGEVIFVEDGPPNSGEPFIKNISQLNNIEIPKIAETKCLMRVLEATEKLKKEVGTNTPIIGVVMSPFSVPVMQMGFEKYLEILYFQPDNFRKLMQKNIEFCVSWANAQIRAGATAICYFDPLASPTIIDREMYLKTGFEVAKKTIGLINGPTATHLASGIALPIINDIINTGTAMVGFSVNDKIDKIKEASSNKICLLGNLNGIDMVNWNDKQTESHIKNLIKGAGINGGLLISDNHGEIPWQVPEEVLLMISESVQKWGNYPLNWVGDYNQS
jgi:uroporphyrinogen decarboxylase